MPKIYTDEFKQSALDLINDGMTQKQVYADLGIPDSDSEKSTSLASSETAHPSVTAWASA